MEKKLFIESIKAIKDQFKHDKKCHKAFSQILPHDYVTNYDHSWICSQLIKVLQTATNDLTESWIDYYIYEIDFGRLDGQVKLNGKPVKLRTANDLWDILNLKKRPH